MDTLSQMMLMGAAGAEKGPLQQAFTSPGTYSWIVPAQVTSISAVVVGGGGSLANAFDTSGNRRPRAGAGGGALSWRNSISVTPGEILTVIVGAGGPALPNIAANQGKSGTAGEASRIQRNSQDLVAAGGGSPGIFNNTSGASGGTRIVGDGGGSGGRGGNAGSHAAASVGGSGGAGGYSGNGGQGANDTSRFISAGSPGAGGGGGGGASALTSETGVTLTSGRPGGGVGIQGQGPNGVGGAVTGNGQPGGVGSPDGLASGVDFGGGGGSANRGGNGAVRIIWPGTTRQFPSTNTADV